MTTLEASIIIKEGKEMLENETVLKDILLRMEEEKSKLNHRKSIKKKVSLHEEEELSSP